MGRMKPTALKMSRGTFASADSGKRVPWEGRGDVARFGVLTRRKVSVGGGRNVGMGRGVDSARGRKRAFWGRRKDFSRWREGFARWRRRNRTCSHKGDKGENRDDFELHIVFAVVVVLNTEY